MTPLTSIIHSLVNIVYDFISRRGCFDFEFLDSSSEMSDEGKTVKETLQSSYCGICKERYNHDENFKVALPCGHCLCQACLGKHFLFSD